MLEAQYKTANGRITVKITGSNVKELFGAIADFSEIFEAETACGVCRGAGIRFAHRVVTIKGGKRADYYELHCTNIRCRARFSFGQLSDGSGGLFPHRKKDGSYLPNGGWSKYNAQSTGDDPADYSGSGPDEEWDQSPASAPGYGGGR